MTQIINILDPVTRRPVQATVVKQFGKTADSLWRVRFADMSEETFTKRDVMAWVRTAKRKADGLSR